MSVYQLMNIKLHELLFCGNVDEDLDHVFKR